MLKDLKVVFMGTPTFSLSILEGLIQKTNVLGVVCQPDKVVGRKKELVYPKTKELAIAYHIPVFQPENIRKEYQEILDLKPDLIVTCAYGQILPMEVLEFPKYGCINVHASLLPKLRGGAPIHHAILDGYKKTGITIMYMDKGMDSGDIIKQREIPILETDTYQSLHDKLSHLGSALLLDVLPTILKGTNERRKQEKEEVTYGLTIKREEELLNFHLPVENVYDKIRGLNPDPGSYCFFEGKSMKVYDSVKIYDSSFKEKQNGEIVKVDKNGMYVKCLDGLIKITDVQMEGKKRMPVSSFLNGKKENITGVILNEGVEYEK